MTFFRAHLHLGEDFEPLQAAPDVGFWQELSQRKLDVWRSLAFKLLDCQFVYIRALSLGKIWTDKFILSCSIKRPWFFQCASLCLLRSFTGLAFFKDSPWPFLVTNHIFNILFIFFSFILQMSKSMHSAFLLTCSYIFLLHPSGFWCSREVLPTKGCLWCGESASGCSESRWGTDPRHRSFCNTLYISKSTFLDGTCFCLPKVSLVVCKYDIYIYIYRPYICTLHQVVNRRLSTDWHVCFVFFTRGRISTRKRSSGHS